MSSSKTLWRTSRTLSGCRRRTAALRRKGSQVRILSGAQKIYAVLREGWQFDIHDGSKIQT